MMEEFANFGKEVNGLMLTCTESTVLKNIIKVKKANMIDYLNELSN